MHFIAAVIRIEAGAELKTSTRSTSRVEPATRVEPEARIAS